MTPPPKPEDSIPSIAAENIRLKEESNRLWDAARHAGYERDKLHVRNLDLMAENSELKARNERLAEAAKKSRYFLENLLIDENVRELKLLNEPEYKELTELVEALSKEQGGGK
jgi:hypothetical protein